MKFFVVLGLVFLQGCIMWFPIDVDYDVEVFLDKDRPDLRSEVGFISYESPSEEVPCPGCWGFELYREAFADNALSVFVYPKSLSEHERRCNWVQDCQGIVSYPSADGSASFSTVDLASFTNSSHKCMDQLYGVSCDKIGGRVYGKGGKKTSSFCLYLCSSCSLNYERSLTKVNEAIEHTLQAWLLRKRFPRMKELKEKRVWTYSNMITRNCRYPITKIKRIERGIRYELWDESGNLTGSLSVHYPTYMYTIEGDNGEYIAEQTAMNKFIEMYCDKTYVGKYKGVVTAYVNEKKCRLGKFR